VKILAVGDSYMPVSYFQRGFQKLESRHEVSYVQADEESPFEPETASELRLTEFLGSPRTLAEHMAGVEVLAVHGAPVTAEVIEAGQDLALVCCARGGPVNVDLQALHPRQLTLVNTPGKNAEAVADLTLAFLIMLARGLPTGILFLQEGNRVRDNWEGARFMGLDLRGHALGLVGFGQVGQRVAARARAFGMRVVVYDPHVDAADVEQCDSLEDLLAESDFVSLHARATSANTHLIDADVLQALRPGRFLINTARETLIDEDALDAALETGHLAGAALDVFEPAPDGERSRLLRHPNVVLTPHLGGATVETLLQGARMLGAEIARFAAGQPLQYAVNGIDPGR